MRDLFRNVMIAILSVVCATGLQAASVYWTGAADGTTWDTSSLNWTNAGGTTVAYTEGDTVHFENTAGGVIRLNAGHGPGGVYVTAPSGIYTFTNASITGTGKLTKAGAGTLYMYAANTFNGGIDISAGEIIVDDFNRLGNAAPVHFTGSAGIILTNDVGGSGGSTVDPVLIDAGVTATIGRRVNTLTQYPYPTWGGNISGPGNLTITGLAGNQVRITGSNSFSGNLRIEGNMSISSDFGLGNAANPIIITNSAYLSLSTFSPSVTTSVGRVVRIDNTGMLIGGRWDGLITGNCTYLMVGGTPLYLANSNNTLVCSSYIFINQGDLKFDSPGCLNGNWIHLDNGYLNGIYISGPSAIYTNGADYYYSAGFGGGTRWSVDDASSVIDWNGRMDGTGVGPAMTKIGPGALNLNNRNQGFTGGFMIRQGRLNVNFKTVALPGITVSNGAAFGGFGTNALTAGYVISGNGSIDPGTSTGLVWSSSAGIMNCPMVEAVTNGAMSFNFEFTQIGSPTYANVSASGNDVLRLTNSTPFNGQTMTSANTNKVYLPAALQPGQNVFRGGFYTDAGNFLSSFSAATINYYVRKVGGPVTYGGQQYDLLANVYKSAVVAAVTTVPDTTYAASGYVTQFEIGIPSGILIQVR